MTHLFRALRALGEKFDENCKIWLRGPYPALPPTAGLWIDAWLRAWRETA